MTIVFDASTLILLAKAELLEQFLEASKMDVVVPTAVARECLGKRSFDALMIGRLIDEQKIRIAAAPDRRLFERMRRDLGLGAGEAEAIALAVATEAELVATGDKSAINACKLAKVRFTTAPAILTMMHEKGAIGRDEAIRKLAILEREGRYKKSIISAARARLEAT
jgi:predicted nucleic acid-binding protein